MTDLPEQLRVMAYDLRNEVYWTASEDPEWNVADAAADRIVELEAALRDAEAIIEAMNGNWIAPSQALGKGRYD